ELKVVARLRRRGYKGRIYKKRGYASFAIMYRRIAGIESQRPATRRIKLQHTSDVIRKERPSSGFENAAHEGEPTKVKWFRADKILGSSEGNESRPPLPEDSKPLETRSRFNSELTLQHSSGRADSNAV